MIQPPPSVMQAARVLSGQTQARLATAVGRTQSTISQLESGDGITDSDLAAAIGYELDIPAALLGAEPPTPKIPHQLASSLPRTAVNRILSSVTMAHARVALLLGPLPVSLPRHPGGTTSTHAHGFAELVRRQWNIPAGQISQLLPTLEGHGVVCVYRDLSVLRTHALASTSADGGVLMLLDSGASRRELAWAIAHELGHLVFGDEPSKAGESDADAFAIEFLAPGRELLNATILTSKELSAEATRWGVPPRALLKRLRQLRRISARRYRELVSELGDVGKTELPAGFIGAPTLLAAAVRKLGGSAAAASRAFVSVEELRIEYLARSVN